MAALAVCGRRCPAEARSALGRHYQATDRERRCNRSEHDVEHDDHHRARDHVDHDLIGGCLHQVRQAQIEEVQRMDESDERQDSEKNAVERSERRARDKLSG